jgi:hypothetical protein
MRFKDSVIALALACAACAPPLPPPKPTKIDVDAAKTQDLMDLPALEVLLAFAQSTKDVTARENSMAETPKRFDAAVRMALATLYYPVDLSNTKPGYQDAKLREQIAQFERKLSSVGGSAGKFGSFQKLNPKVEANGVLSYYEFSELTRIAGLAQSLPVIPGGGSDTLNVYVNGSGRFAYAGTEGSWEIIGDQIAFPLNLVEITCSGMTGFCEVRETDIAAPSHLGLASSSGGQISVYSTTGSSSFQITRWSDGIVEARSMPPLGKPECRYTTMTINSLTSQVTQVTQDGAAPCESVLGSSLPRLEKPRVTILRPSGPIFAKYFDDLFTEVERYHGPLAAERYTRPWTGFSAKK